MDPPALQLSFDDQRTMSDYESVDLAGSSRCFAMDPHPLSSLPAHRSVRLPSQLHVPSPSSQLSLCCISPGSDLVSSHLAQLSLLLPHHGFFPSPPHILPCILTSVSGSAPKSRGSSLIWFLPFNISRG
ncbi:hypothetical protein ATANTOWER_024459 [Ataeniobius toweri]|uniref:Uncharacterized protein n=1 Tax=Ataeniobius toweri TaxID=208326 RepID=A0ABU7AS87_9TELE|nr:hypothetical protein [Ataeniobius toweri]